MSLGANGLTITIYHDPACGASRNALALIRQDGCEPTVIQYLKTPPVRARLQQLVKEMDMPARASLRRQGTPYHEIRLDDPKWSDDDLSCFMLAHPIFINRPIVATPRGVRLCRPAERVLDILPKSEKAKPKRVKPKRVKRA